MEPPQATDQCFSQADAHAASLWSLGTGRAAEPLWAHRTHCCASECRNSGLCQNGQARIWNLYHEIWLTHMAIWMGLKHIIFIHFISIEWGYHPYTPQIMSILLQWIVIWKLWETMRNHWIVGQPIFRENPLVAMMERAAKFWLRLQVRHTLVPSSVLW